MSSRTLSFHYGKHYKGYVDKANALIKNSPYEPIPLVEIIVKCYNSPSDELARNIFNNASQAWNHDFFWKCMKPNGGGKPSGKLAELINASFGSFEKFKEKFIEGGLTQFGSGWVWLAFDGKKLVITKSLNAASPWVMNMKPLLTCDVWEHAYYLDYQNRRIDFVKAFLEHLVNWDFVETQIPDNIKKIAK
ncbi:MAG: superoxide dismutase [Lentisphaerae bacterium GWF2_45_14]|nr:MAG: superoxide dismutase [Lentisphaerae bacterium GWF2_45_14]